MEEGVAHEHLRSGSIHTSLIVNDPADTMAPRPTVMVIGCGNLLRGDDGVGPILVRHLAEQGVPAHVRLADGGTAGMDVAFAMRGMRKVVIVDAAITGAEPGTMYRVPGERFEELPPLGQIQLHSFKWDHAIAFARWALKDDFPSDVEVWLIEAEQLDPGADLSPRVRVAMEAIGAQIISELEEFA